MSNLMDIAIQLLIAEEAARLNKSSSWEQMKTLVLPRLAHTYYIKEQNFKIPGVILEEKGAGELKELFIKSTNKGYRLIIIVDNATAYNNSYTWFEEASRYIDNISAFKNDGGEYILHITNIRFTDNIKIQIEPDPTSTDKASTIDQIIYTLEIWVQNNAVNTRNTT